MIRIQDSGFRIQEPGARSGRARVKTLRANCARLSSPLQRSFKAQELRSSGKTVITVFFGTSFSEMSKTADRNFLSKLPRESS